MSESAKTNPAAPSPASHATPGPWHVQPIRHGDEVVGYNVDAERVDPAHSTEFPYFCIENIANAHLIAAAPDLYEALKWLTHLCAGVSKDGGSDISQQEYNDCNEQARAALAKAQGTE